MDNTLTLIDQARQGDGVAIESFLLLVEQHHWPKIRWSFGRSLPGFLTELDLRQEFLVGVWRAIPKVDMEIGNPLTYLLWRGRMYMIGKVRSRVVSAYTALCTDCGHEGRFQWKGTPVCQKCNSREIDIWRNRVTTEDDEVDIVNGWEDPSDPLVALEEEEFFLDIRGKLSGRSRDLFDALIVQGINRETSNNYLAEIAGIWGCSTTNVARALKRLQAHILEIYRADETSELLEKIVLAA